MIIKVINMKIICKQNTEIFGMKNIYLKELTFKNDYKKTTLKYHYHNDYEIHMIFKGKQCYEISGGLYEAKEQEFILIPPGEKHCMMYASENLLKYPITFSSGILKGICSYHGRIPGTVFQGIEFISEEMKRKTPSAFLLSQNRTVEVITLLLREAGYEEKSIDSEKITDDDKNRLAKKFIADNIEQNLSVKDVATYCHLSERQLTRNFIMTEGISPAKYITAEKMKRVGECVKNTDLSLKQISEKFSFNNEYYFNTAFKKHFGMPPLSYRKMNS